jgi:uroporphyrin-III C-methyltransferase
VLHDALVHPDTLKLATRARFIDVGKRYGKVSTEQRFIHRALVEAARTHEVVVRLKGGDPMMFGRAQEELDALAAAGVEAEVVPGITAALAAAATLRVSLTRRGIARTVSFLTPRVGKGETDPSGFRPRSQRTPSSSTWPPAPVRRSPVP